jgi:hypothetical protein
MWDSDKAAGFDVLIDTLHGDDYDHAASARDELARLTAAVAALVPLFREALSNNDGICPICGNGQFCQPDCRLAAALATHKGIK